MSTVGETLAFTFHPVDTIRVGLENQSLDPDLNFPRVWGCSDLGFWFSSVKREEPFSVFRSGSELLRAAWGVGSLGFGLCPLKRCVTQLQDLDLVTRRVVLVQTHL